jgi:hypothetical protein
MELKTFEHALPGLLRTQRGQYALIHQDQVDSTWKTEDEAYTEGCKRFGADPFLVMLIESPEPPVPIFQEVSQCPSSPGH